MAAGMAAVWTVLYAAAMHQTSAQIAQVAPFRRRTQYTDEKYTTEPPGCTTAGYTGTYCILYCIATESCREDDEKIPYPKSETIFAWLIVCGPNKDACRRFKLDWKPSSTYVICKGGGEVCSEAKAAFDAGHVYCEPGACDRSLKSKGVESVNDQKQLVTFDDGLEFVFPSATASSATVKLGPPKDCVGAFGSWSACTTTCGEGTRSATWEISVPAAFGGKSCENIAKKSSACNIKDCLTTTTTKANRIGSNSTHARSDRRRRGSSTMETVAVVAGAVAGVAVIGGAVAAVAGGTAAAAGTGAAAAAGTGGAIGGSVTACAAGGGAASSSSVTAAVIAVMGGSSAALTVGGATTYALARKYGLIASDLQKSSLLNVETEHALLVRTDPLVGLQDEPLVSFEAAVDRLLVDLAPVKVQKNPAHSAGKSKNNQPDHADACAELLATDAKDRRAARDGMDNVATGESPAKVTEVQAWKLRKAVTKSMRWAQDPLVQAKYPEGMTADMAAAIALYTQETFVYSRMNQALRERNTAELESFLPFMKLLLTALHKLPLLRATVYRGVRLDLNEVYGRLMSDESTPHRQGEVWTWWSFSSTTMDLQMLLGNKMFLGSKGPRTLFSIDAVGVDIANFSAHCKEQEILLLPGSRFGLVDLPQSDPSDPSLWRISVRSVDYDDATCLIDFKHPDWRMF